MKIERCELLKLLELYIDEEHKFLESHQKRVAFYSSIISAVLAATIAGIFKSTESIHYLFLIVGPILIYIICLIALDGTFRFYQRYLETVTQRAKIEQLLLLTQPTVVNDRKNILYWSDEPVIPERLLQSRMNMESSSIFIEQSKNKGYQKITKLFFILFQSIAFMLALFLILLYFNA